MKHLICAAAALTALSAPATAAPTLYGNRAAFNAGVTGVVNNDLNALPTGPVSTVFGVETITSGSFATGYISSYGNGFGQALGGADAGGVNNFDSVVITFTAPIYAFAFDDLDLTPDEYANVLVSFVGGGSASYTLSETDSDFSTAAFFGLSSDVALQSVTVYSSNAPGDPVGARANQIDNLAISRIRQEGGVPEPASWAMMIAGFGVVGATMRRRRPVSVGFV